MEHPSWVGMLVAFKPGSVQSSPERNMCIVVSMSPTSVPFIHRRDELSEHNVPIRERAPPLSSGSVLDYRSLPPVFESRGGHICRLFRLWLCIITSGGRSAHLAYLVHKSGCKTSIIIIILSEKKWGNGLNLGQHREARWESRPDCWCVCDSLLSRHYT